MPSIIIHCGCTTSKHGGSQGAKFQDERYGSGMRVATTGPKTESRCTVCGDMHIRRGVK